MSELNEDLSLVESCADMLAHFHRLISVIETNTRTLIVTVRESKGSNEFFNGRLKPAGSLPYDKA